jgi:hypothetical protein
LRPRLRVASAGDEWTERRSLEILRFGFELLQKRVALPHPVDDISFAWDKQKNMSPWAGTKQQQTIKK